MPPLIELKDVSLYSEGGKAVFEGVSASFSGGENVAIVAPLASGKSSLVRLLTGFLRPDKGTVVVFGRDISGLDPGALRDIRKKIGCVLKDTALISNLKVIENAALPLLYHSGLSYDECMARAKTLLDASGFKGDEWGLPGPLPLFAKKLVMAARALSLEPQAVIVENLADGLTGQERERIASFMLKYIEGGDRLFISTAHDINEAAVLKPARIVRIEGAAFAERAF